MIPPLCTDPSLAFHNSSPVLASSACSQPRASGTNTSPPAVDSRLASGGSEYFTDHVTFPVVGSRASTCPCILSPGGSFMVKVAPILSWANGSVIGDVLVMSRSMHHSLRSEEHT